jgi:hypothetical protein
VVGDVGGVLAENIAHDLVDGVIALLLEGIIDGGQDHPDLLVLVNADAEFACVVDVVHRAHPLFLVTAILAYNGPVVKRKSKNLQGNPSMKNL